MKRKSLLFLLLLALGLPWAAKAQETLTVYENETTTNSNVPVWGLWADNSLQCEIVYPASELEDMAGGVISALKFHTNSTSTNIGTASASNNWDGTFTIFIKEVEATTLSAFTGTTGATTVLEGQQIGVVNGEMTITFTTPYTYGGGNLLVGVYYTTGGHYCSVTWHGKSVSGASIYGRSGQSYSATQGNFIPKTTFTYTAGEAPCCPKPKSLTCTGYTANTATFTWTNGGDETQWQLEYGTASDFTGASTVTIAQNDLVNGAYTLNGLTADQTYYARIKAYCASCTPNYSDPSNTCEFKPTAAQHFTVNDGTTTSDYVPVYGYWADSKQQSEFIIPSTSLTELAGLTLQAMKFYANYNFTSTGTFQVYLREVENSTFSNTTFYGTEGATTVYTGTITVSSTDGMTITFANDGYDYNGGNLLIGFYQETGGNCSSSGDKFYGISANGASISMYSSNAVVQRNFLPKTTFTYLPSSTPKPRNLVVSDITSETATVTWTAPADNVTGYQYQYKYATTPTWPETWNSLAANVTHKDLVALAANTLYDFRVRANYAEGDSDPAEIQFTTEATCLPVTNITVSDITSTGAKLAWTPGGSETNWQYICVAHGDTPDWTSQLVITSNTNTNVPANILAGTGLEPQPNTEYDFYVRANCGGGDYSEAAMLTFRTACGVITSFPVNYGFETSEGFPSNAAYPTTNPLGDCWRNEATVQNGTNATYVWGTSTSNKNGGSQALVLPDKGNSTNFAKTMLVFPPMDFTSANGYTVSFWIYRSTTGSNPEGFKVYASDTDTISANAVELGHYSRYYNIAYPVIESAAGWYKYETPVITMTGTVYIIFEGQSYYGSATYVDDITVKEVVNVTAYQIVNTVSNSEDEMTWDEFAAHVNAGHHFTHSTIELKESIANNQNPITTMVGTEVNPFTGTFDGKGHSINAMDIESDEAGAAPFHYISNATIKNLGVNGNVTQTNTTDGGYHTAGLVGFAWSGTNTIENCEVNTSITITTLGGGIVGHAKSSTLYLTGCYYAGGIENTTPSSNTNRGVGGLVGWCDNATLYIKNCVYDGINGYSGDGSSVYFHPVACKTGGATVTAYVSNCYYLCDEPAADNDGANNVATTEGRKAYMVTGAEGIIVDLPSAAIHYTCSNIWGDNTGSWNGIKIGNDIYGGEGKTLTLNLSGANGYAADHGTLTPSDGQYTLLMEAHDTQISGVSCPVPYNLAVAENGLTNHTATIQWEGEHQGYQLWYRTAAYMDDPDTEESFNSTSIPTGWTNYTGQLNEAEGTATLSSASGWSFGSANGVFDSHARVNIYSTGCYKWLVTPSIEVTSGYGLSFDVALTKYSNTLQPVDPSQQLDDKFIVLISTDDKATWTVLRKWDNAGSPYVYNNIVCSATGENVTLDLSAYAGTTAYIAFYGESTVSGGDNNLHIDNVAFGTLIPAGEYWIDPNQPYLIEANSYTIEGLAAETSYEVEIRGYCGAEDGFSESTDIITFTTDIACPAPSALQIVENSVKSSQVGLSWTNGGAEDWIVAYMADGDTDYTTVNVATADVTIEGATVTYTLTGLEAETEYVVKVQDNCEASYEGDGTSGWSNEESFTTLKYCAQPTNVTVSNVVHYNADVAWTGDSDGFTVKYREAASIGDPVLTEGFENNGSNIPEGWTHIGNGALIINTTASRVHNGAKSLRFSGATSDNVVVLPELGAEANTMSVSFWSLAESSTSSGTFQVGYVTNATDASTFQVVGDYNASAHLSYTQETVSLASAPAGARVAFRHTSVASNYWWWIDDIVIGTPVAAGEWQTVNVNGVTTTTTLESLTPGTKYELVVVPSCDETNASESVFFTTISANHKLFITEGYWNVDSNWMPAGAPTVEQDVELRANVTIPSGYVATADIITGTGDSAGEGIYTLTIEDGGQLIFQNDYVNNHGPHLYATVKKNLSGYGTENVETNLGYYLISSPLRSTIYNHTSSSTPNITSTGLLTGNYDFYRWEYGASDELEWRNYKATPFNMTSSAYNTLYGYLYANENDVELTFTGQIEHNYNYGHYQSVRDWSDDYSFGAWWLLGNPFVCTAYVVSTTVDGTPLVTDANTAQPFYKMNGDGNGFTAVAAGTPVAPMEGIFYETTAPTGTYEKVFMSTITPAAQNNSKLNMNLRSGDKQLDNAILVFGGEQQLGKMTFRENSSKIYMPVDGKDYAIATAESNMGEMPVSFKAEHNGTYTLSFNAEEVSFAYLHLIDNLTGVETDLLSTPSYTFDASTTDYESRFKLVFATGNNSNDDNFAFFSNGSFVINNEGEATLQVVDVMGRIIKSESINGCASVNVNAAPGVYMLRLVNGDNVKVQKVVVR